MQHIAKTTVGETTIYLTEVDSDVYSVYEWRSGRPERAEQYMPLHDALSTFDMTVKSRILNHVSAIA